MNLEDIRDIKPPVGFPANPDFLFLAAVIIALAVLIFLIKFFKKRLEKTKARFLGSIAVNLEEIGARFTKIDCVRDDIAKTANYCLGTLVRYSWEDKKRLHLDPNVEGAILVEFYKK